MFSSDPDVVSSVTDESPAPDGWAYESLKWRTRSRSLGLLLMSPESSLCSQTWQSPQETAGLKQLTASPRRVLVSQIYSLHTYCVQNVSFHLPTQR